jgi:alcohol dehydrogenase
VLAFSNPVRVEFGADALAGLPDAVGERDCILVTSAGMASRGALREIEAGLADRIVATFSDVLPNPTIASCTMAFDALQGVEAGLLVALGGGSVIDTAKALAAQRAHPSGPGWLAGHLRDGRPFPEPFVPPAIIAIPTTAGTGSEVTMWATIWDDESATKRSISHPFLYPEAALLDPALTHSVPRATTVPAAFDALSHAMEAIWNRAANPVSDALAMRAIRLIPGALPRVLESPDDARAREALMSAALLAGLAISSTRTALAHSISYPLTAERGLPHGIACSLTLPELLRAVDRERPDRSRLIVEAMRSGSAEKAAHELSELFAIAGTGELLRRHVPSTATLRAIRGGYIAPGRAENFVLDVDQAWAAELLERAYSATR